MRHFRIYLLTIIISILQIYCSPCIGRRILPKKSIEIESFASALIGDPEESIPVLPNLGFALRYGLADKITIGTTLNVTGFALEGTLLMEPFAVFNLLKKHGKLPAVNLYTAVPFVCFFKNPGLRVFPLIGICPVWGADKFDIFFSCESSFDRKQFDNGVDIHASLRAGGTFYPLAHRGIYAEAGFLNINHPSWINNSKKGVFSISIGYTRNITLSGNKHEND